MSARSRLLVAVLSTGVIAYVAVGAVLGRVLGDTTYGQLAVFNEVIHLVVNNYVEERINLDRTMAGANLGLLDALDGDSALLDAEELRAYQQPAKDTDADVGLVIARRIGFLVVVAAREGSPAQKAGFRSGDIIKTIDGRHTRPLGVPVGERLLRGAPGSVVKLKVLRGSMDPLEFSLVRERWTAAPPRSRLLNDAEGIGYLKVSEFPVRVADDVRGEIESLKRGGARRLVLDLRGACWGRPEEAAKVAELFLNGGVVTRLTGRKFPEQVLAAEPSRTAWREPLAVLVDSGTAGPGEIVAAALLDAGRSPLVGRHTFGRAGVQRLVGLPEGGLLLTVAKYLRPNGEAIHGRGLAPSAPVKDSDEEPEPDKPAPDLILEKALELLKAEARKAA
jgi:carboxyl-terminal processing protease